MTSTKPEKAQSLPVSFVWAPAFGRLYDGRLLAESRGAWKKRRAPRNLLNRFISIADSANTEAAVVSFARQWGIIGLCKHGLPILHDPACKKTSDTISAHHSFARLLEVLLRIGLELNKRRIADPVEWQLADDLLVDDDPERQNKSPDWDSAVSFGSTLRLISLNHLRFARGRFQNIMRRLATMVRLQPQLAWINGAWSIDFNCSRGSNLAAILTIQLMAAIGGHTMRKCRACPRWFTPIGRQVYCGRCGIRASWRDAKKRQRQAL